MKFKVKIKIEEFSKIDENNPSEMDTNDEGTAFIPLYNFDENEFIDKVNEVHKTQLTK